MFPQSELDNYKLQVELLQEKLQRSEISRQHLEHKLDKILQQRDEHEKTVRSKAKQKYKIFLEEQQRRNQRNKQLIQMLEHIEQKTEAMNAKSERLKMMKLQYEMYFAKLVHAQTKRCIQSSVGSVTQIAIPASSQPVQSVMEANNYLTNTETPTTYVYNPYQSINANECENALFCTPQHEKMQRQVAETPTLQNVVHTKRNDCMDFKNENTVPSKNLEQFYQHQAKPGAGNTNAVVAVNSAFNKLELPKTSVCAPQLNANISLSSVANSLEEIPKSGHLVPEAHRAVEPVKRFTPSNNITENNDSPTNDFRPPHNAYFSNETGLELVSRNRENAISNGHKVNESVNFLQESRKEIKTTSDNLKERNELDAFNAIVPKLNDESAPSSNMEPANKGNEFGMNTSQIKTIIKEPKTNENISLANNTAAPVSIENIENEIYGELVSPLEVDEVHKTEESIVSKKLLEKLAPPPENLETQHNPSKETSIKLDIVPDTKNTENVSEQDVGSSNYEQSVVYDNYQNDQQPEQLANDFANYTNYENVNNAVIEESQAEQEQYDYSNYDPAQYSYPGYIYDDTTGEYKPDPNAPADQYATDQQFYDLQYQQQQEFDYNQTYEEVPATTSAAAENQEYNNYVIPAPESVSDLDSSNTNAEPQRSGTRPETLAFKADLATELPSLSSSKVSKPTSILSTAEKFDSQKKKKRVNFIDNSETEESTATDEKLSSTKIADGNLAGSSENEFVSSTNLEAELKTT